MHTVQKCYSRLNMIIQSSFDKIQNLWRYRINSKHFWKYSFIHRTCDLEFSRTPDLIFFEKTSYQPLLPQPRTKIFIRRRYSEQVPAPGNKTVWPATLKFSSALSFRQVQAETIDILHAAACKRCCGNLWRQIELFI